MRHTLTALAMLAIAACAPQPDNGTWRLVTEQADGSSQIADYGLTLSDCDALVDAWLARPYSPGEPAAVGLRYWEPSRAKFFFLERFRQLTSAVR